MGYTTEFKGQVDFDKSLTIPQLNYLNAFAASRRMQRDSLKTEALDDPKRKAVGLPVGVQGGYYVGDEEGRDVVDNNNPPKGQPGLWCQWVPTEDGMGMEWDGGEKFYNFEEWMKYLIDHFLKPWGITVNGEIQWQGEDMSDRGLIIVTDNVVTTQNLR